MKKLLFCTILWVTILESTPPVIPLDTFIRRAQELAEFPVDEKSLNWADPDYAAYIRSREPGFIKKLLIKMGLLENGDRLMSIKTALIAATDRRKKIAVRPAIETIQADKNTRFIIFGDLDGTYHSLVRDLQELRRLKIIDNNLVITDKNAYMVLLGNTINRGPHSFEILDLIIALMRQNPTNLLYLRGPQETDGFWKSFFAMRTPLKRWELLWGSSNLQITPLENELNNFFNTLPDILCIDDNKQIIYCSHNPVSPAILEEKPAEAIFIGSTGNRALGQGAGLLFTGFTMGAAEWSLLSGPNQANQKFLGLKSDSFCICNIGETLANSTLTHYTHIIKTDQPFKTKDYQVSLGYKLDDKHPLIPREVIPLYSSLCLSGPSRTLGFGVTHGILAACISTNNAGGINGRFLKPVIYDDSYDPTSAAHNIELFLKRQSDVSIMVPIGSPTLAEYIDRVKTGEVKVFFPVTGAPLFRNPDTTGIVHARQAYPYEARCLIDHIVKDYRSRKFAIIYQDDAFGQPLFQASVEEFKKLGLKDWLAIPFSRDQISFTEEAKKLELAKPEAIGIFFASSTLAQNLLTTLSSTFPMGKHIFTTSFLADDTFKYFLKSRGINLTFSYTMPDPYDHSTQLIKNYRQAMDNVHYSYDSNSLEGYIATSLMTDAIRHLEPPFTGTKFLSYFRSLKNYPFEGLSLTYSDQGLGFNLPIWIKTEKNTWEKCSAGGIEQ